MNASEVQTGIEERLAPQPDRDRYRGLAGFIISAMSAALSLFAILSWMHSAKIDVSELEGGPAFSANLSMNLFPLLAAALGIVVAAVGVILTLISMYGKPGRSAFSMLHLLSLLLLTPGAYLTCRVAIWAASVS